MAKQIIGWLCLTAFLFSLGWKLNDSGAHLGDRGLIIIIIILVGLILALVIRKVLRA